MITSRISAPKSRTMRQALFGVLALSFSGLASVAAACPNAALIGQQLSYSSNALQTARTHSVVAGGSSDLSTCPQPGNGWVANRPDFDLSFSGNASGRDLVFRVDATCDSVLLINDANGQWHFDDDGGNGLNSRIQLSHAANGTYDVWVGTYGSTTCAASISFETTGGGLIPGLPQLPQIPGLPQLPQLPQLPIPVPPTPTPPPQFLTCPNPSQNGQMLAFNAWNLRTPETFSVTAGGPANLGACQTVPGHGHVSQRPDFTLDFLSNQINRALEFRTTGACDTVLLVSGPNGQYEYNDDSNGLSSRVRFNTPLLGQYDIWVGTFGTTNCATSLVIETIELNAPPPPPPPPPPVVCPDPSQNGQMLTFDGQGLWLPERFNVTAGGGANLNNCPSVPGHGHIAQRPDFTLNFTGNPRNYDLEFRVEGTCDPVLLVQDSRGQWQYNDDDTNGGTNSRLRISNARPGLFDIWVGTFGTQSCQATLIAETFTGASTPPPPPPPVETCPSLSPNGQMLTYAARDLQSQVRFDTIAGGPVDLSTCQAVPGAGHIPLSPSYTLNLTANSQAFDLDFQIDATCDSVLLVYDPSGDWHFNDDAAPGDLNSNLRMNAAQPGRYDIWVGTYGSATCRGSLLLQTIGTAPPLPPQPVVLPDPGNLTRYRSQVGDTLHFEVTGATSGSIWGTDIYTDDSSLSRAAVHAGQVHPGQTGIVSVTVLPGQSSYQGSLRNGVQSSNNGAWTGSYQFASPQATQPSAAGAWRMDANGWAAQLALTWTGADWTGTITFDATGIAEALADIRFDPSNGALRFTRPVPAATQEFRGFVDNNQIRGQYSVLNGPFSFPWSATR